MKQEEEALAGIVGEQKNQGADGHHMPAPTRSPVLISKGPGKNIQTCKSFQISNGGF
jgi:hypothetical protein